MDGRGDKWMKGLQDRMTRAGRELAETQERRVELAQRLGVLVGRVHELRGELAWLSSQFLKMLDEPGDAERGNDAGEAAQADAGGEAVNESWES